MSIEKTKQDKSAAFVEYIIKRSQNDKAVAAALRRADNPDTEYQSWETLVAFHIDLEKPWERLPYATIAAAIAKAKIKSDGKDSIGRGIASCHDEKNQNTKLRRLLACDSVAEACRILRPLLSLITSKGQASLNYSLLLKELLEFHWKKQDIKARWAQNFYSYYYARDKKSGEITGGAA